MRLHTKKILLSALTLLFLQINTAYSQKNSLDTLSIGLDRFMSQDKFKPMADFLERELNVPIKYENFNSLVELSGDYTKYDLLYCNGFAFAYTQVLDLPFESFLARANAKNEPLSYNSCIITKFGGSLINIEQAISQAASLKMSFTYASSTSGHIIPRIYLTDKIGTNLENSFKAVDFQSSHQDVIAKVIEGELDLGACSCPTLEDEVIKNKDLEGQYKILWSSEEIPHAIWVTGSRIDMNMKTKLTKAFSHLQTDPSAWNLFLLPGMTQFTTVENSSFDFLIDQLKKDAELEFYLYYYESL